MAIVSDDPELAHSTTQGEVPIGISHAISAKAAIRRGIIVIHSLHRVCVAIASRLRNLAYRILGVKIKGNCWLRAIEIPRGWKNIQLDLCALDRGVTLLVTEGADSQPEIRIGQGTYINRATTIDAHQSVQVGAGCMIGPHCYITDADHGIQPGIAVRQQPMITAAVVIEDGAWLGAHVTVLKGVTIGAGAVVGAGSVVTKSVPANAIVVGIPAKFVRSRHCYAKAS